ncbi:hypothetical protein [Mesorhizobium sophorae]|uniref:hypothetical protein n=1 Tax=Mesorhizobium sophorae TaxID=1300294 RepID=UPI00117C72BA|nr:hypothetical protein [Mesorhizobium sophorae]
MTALIYRLAEDHDGAWTLVFDPEDLHLYVEFAGPEIASDPVDWMTVEDFLARRPQGSLHKRCTRISSRFCARRWGDSVSDAEGFAEAVDLFAAGYDP